MRKKNVVKRRAGCFQKVDNVRTPSLWILLKEATESPFVRRFHRAHYCSAKNLVAQPVWLSSLVGRVASLPTREESHTRNPWEFQRLHAFRKTHW
jgi:hypothetical protein